ncbi:MAG: PorP/SprF family type IX secretion system membrane protein, partial [Bacteroidota bacterium]
FSLPQLFNNNLTGGVSDARQSVHYFLSSGYVFNMNRKIKIKPAVFAKFVPGAPISLDINTNVNILDRLEVGVSYRWDDSIDLLVILPVGKHLTFAYAYDATITELGDYNRGSHEIMLRYEFLVNGKKEKILTPRYF